MRSSGSVAANRQVLPETTLAIGGGPLTLALTGASCSMAAAFTRSASSAVAA